MVLPQTRQKPASEQSAASLLSLEEYSMLDPAKFEHWAESIVAISQYAKTNPESQGVERVCPRQAIYPGSQYGQHVTTEARSLADRLLASLEFVKAGTLDGHASAAVELAMRDHIYELAALSIATNKALAHSQSPYRVRMYARTSQQWSDVESIQTCATEIHDVRTGRRVDLVSSSID